jgi:hypothetical protein
MLLLQRNGGEMGNKSSQNGLAKVVVKNYILVDDLLDMDPHVQ